MCSTICKDTSKYIKILQCNIGGDPQARLAKGSVLRNLIDSHNPTMILLTETKRKRKYIPLLPHYNFFSWDPLENSSGGSVLYFKDTLRFRISIAFESTCNSIVWVHLRHHVSASEDLYICGVYAPNASSPRDRITSFYNELNCTTFLFQDRQGHCILAGDFNARIGNVSGDHATNTNMDPFLDFINYHPPLVNFNVLKTYGHYTFVNISNGNSSIIDYLLSDIHPSKIVEHVVLPGHIGTSAQTAHKALLTTILQKSKEETFPKPNKIPKWRAVTENNQNRYCKTLHDELTKLADESVSYKTIVTVLNRSKTNSLGRMRPRPINTSSNTTPQIDYLDYALGRALENHRINPSKGNLIKAQALERKLRDLRNVHETKTLLEFIDRLESLHQIQKMRQFYKKVKERTQPGTNKTLVIHNPESSNHNPYYSSTCDEYLKFWTRYLEMKFANSSSIPCGHSRMHLYSSLKRIKSKPCDSNMDKDLTKSEVCLAIRTLKNMKTAGMDEITNEDIKLIENIRPGIIHTALQKLWMNETSPSEFQQSLVHLFPKPGKPGKPRDLRLQKNYRPIALLSTFRKLYEVILSSRILGSVALCQSQFGFRPRRSTSDCIFLLVEAILEARYVVRGPRCGKQQKLYSAFLDLEGAFDGVPRQLLWQKMDSRFGIRGKLLRVIIDLYTNTTGKATVNNLTTKRFSIHSGVLQGSALGPTLFLLFIDDLLEMLHESKLGIKMDVFILSVLAYADDITLFSVDAAKLQLLLNLCYSWSITNGMSFGIDNCFAVVFNSRSKKPDALPSFHFGGTKRCPKKLKSFFPEQAPHLYLGFKLTDHVTRTKIDCFNAIPHSLGA